MKSDNLQTQSIKKNILLSTEYQVITLITPFITTPYIARVLGAEGIGIYSFTMPIETYFAMFATLGTISYGTREISRTRNVLIATKFFVAVYKSSVENNIERAAEQEISHGNIDYEFNFKIFD